MFDIEQLNQIEPSLSIQKSNRTDNNLTLFLAGAVAAVAGVVAMVASGQVDVNVQLKNKGDD
jgi:hypothetical protein